MTKIFYAADVHGSEVCFKKFVNAGSFYKVNVLILSGDLTGKMIIPIIEQERGIFKADFLGIERIVNDDNELEILSNDIRKAGFYPYVTNLKEAEELRANKDKRDQLFLQLMAESMSRWVKIAEERLKPLGIRIFMMPGNDDPFVIDPVLKSSDYVVNPEDKVVNINGHSMISLGWSNRTPWNSPRETDEENLAKMIDTRIAQIDKIDSCIFNFHCPPFSSGIDYAPQLDKQMRPTTSVSGIMMVPVGSKAVRQSIEKYQPLLGLHGHIHESKGITRIGRTICFNPGSNYTQGILQGAIISLEKSKVKSYLLVSG